MAVVIEWAPFTAVPGVSDEQVCAASRHLQEHFLARQPGMIRRQLLKSADGAWADLVHWESRAALDAAMGNVGSSAACAAYFTLLGPARPVEGPMQTFEVVETYD